MNRFTATPNPTWPGGTLLLCFEDVAKVGQSVTVEVVNGLPEGDPGRRAEYPEIVLGKTGAAA